MKHHSIKEKTVRCCRKNMSDVQEDARKWAQEIKKEFHPDLLIFVAKSGFLFAKPMAEVFQCRMADIAAQRPASRVKDKMKKVIRFIPESMVSAILRSPAMYRFHGRQTQRNIEITKRYRQLCQKKHQKILIVDDSVDTGWTLKKVKEIVVQDFPGAVIKTAGYSVIADSKRRMPVDYFRCEDTIVLTATSRKSAEYEAFLEEYRAWILQAEDNSIC